MNAIEHPNIFMRSLATRDTGSEIAAALPETIAACRLSGFDLVIVETSGIGQGDTAIVPQVNTSMYVMTPEFGAASQLEKIDMLDFADFVAINKFDRTRREDALRDVRKQVQRNHNFFSTPAEEMPVFGTIASRFNDDGVTALYHSLVAQLEEKGLKLGPGKLPVTSVKHSTGATVIVPPQTRPLSGRDRGTVRDLSPGDRNTSQNRARPAGVAHGEIACFSNPVSRPIDFDELIAVKNAQLDPECRNLIDQWPEMLRELLRRRVCGEDPRS